MQEIHAKQALTPDGWLGDLRLRIEDGRVKRLASGSAEGACSVDMLLPAPTNLHSHAFQRAMAGLTETRGPDPRDSFWTWRQLMYQYLDRLRPEDVQAIAELVFMEMLEAGYGAVAEFHYLHHDIKGASYGQLSEMAARITTAAQNAGIGLTLLPVLYMQGGCDGRALQGSQQRFGCDLERFARLHGEIAGLIAKGPRDFGIGIAPHSLRAVPPAALAQLRQIISQGPIHMHLAEQLAEVEEVKAHYGARPVEWLLQNADVTPEWSLIHCTQMTDTETQALARTGAAAGLCPITEASLGDGVFNGTTFQAAGGRLGVGSDSNIHIALWEELAMLEYSQRLRDHSRAALATAKQSTGRVLFDAVCQTGAQAAGRASGTIAEGQFADLIAVSTDNEFLCNRRGDTALDSLIFTGRGRACVSDVWSAGRHMVRHGHHIDRERIRRRFIETCQTVGQEI
jgi:formiminoglutamate deiminase